MHISTVTLTVEVFSVQYNSETFKNNIISLNYAFLRMLTKPVLICLFCKDL